MIVDMKIDWEQNISYRDDRTDKRTYKEFVLGALLCIPLT